MSENYFLKSKRIGFRTWSFEDMSLAIELWSDLEITRFIGGPFSDSHIQRMLFIEGAILRQHNIQYWPIFLLENNEFIGCCGLRPYQPTERVYEIGVQIKSSCWRKGYATEAVNMVVEYALAKLHAASLFAGHHPENAVSKKLLEKLGFRYTYDEYYEPTGLDHPSYILHPPNNR